MGIHQTVEVLNDMVEAGVIGPYAIGGAFAAFRYIQASVTEDLDVLVSFDDATRPASGLVTLGPIVPYLAGRGFTNCCGGLYPAWASETSASGLTFPQPCHPLSA